MAVRLTAEERRLLSADVPEGVSMAMRVLMATAEAMGADSLVPIRSAHIDSCIYFADAGVLFAEKLRAGGGRVCVPSTLNVGLLDQRDPARVRAGPHQKDMARRLARAMLAMGCTPSWTCAPYQAGHRPALGDQIAWAESNAIVFANSILGARTNRYGDFFDICAAITGRAPHAGLHRDENRRATLLIDLALLPPALLAEETLYPALGSWLGRVAGTAIAALDGLPPDVPEDRLKALAAAAASTGQVGLFHVIGVTPEAPNRDTVFGGRPPEQILTPSGADLRAARDRLSTATGRHIDCIALGSPHFSEDECRRLARLCRGRRFAKPVYVCTRADVVTALEARGERARIEAAGGIFVVGTCVIVAPILKQSSGVMMTNSGKFAHYGPATVGHEVVFGSLADCVRSAEAGHIVRDEAPWRAA